MEEPETYGEEKQPHEEVEKEEKIILNAAVDKFMKNKKVAIIVMLGLALCFLVIGMTVKYNNLVNAYNIVVDEANVCRMEQKPLTYQIIPDARWFGSIPGIGIDVEVDNDS